MTGFSPLPLAQEAGHDDDQQKFKGVSRILGPPWARLPTITIGLLGVQIFWSVEMSYASPYLISLGLSKSNMAIVFVAGPLSGLIMQPLIGVLADNCHSRFGRRRPYMILGSLLCITGMLLLGFTRGVASVFTGWDNDSNDTLTIWLAVFAIYMIDFSINIVQAVDRALLVDTLPSTDQAAGNAWAARMLGVGSVVGFFLGNINLTRLFPFLGNTQLQVLAVIVSILLLAGHITMAIFVKEKVLLKIRSVSGKSNRKSITGEIKEIWVNILTLPRVIRQICMIQFFAWIAWFPLLFYSTLYVGDLYKRTAPIPTSPLEQAAVDAEANRLGSRALFFSALLSLLGSFALPAFVTEAAGNVSPTMSKPHQPRWQTLLHVPRHLQIHLSTLWAIGHMVFAGCMLATFFTHTVWGATFIITITGFSWAVTQWAPFSLLAEAILTEPAEQGVDDTGSIRLADTRTPNDSERTVFLSGEDSDNDEDDRRRSEDRRRVLGHSGAQVSRIDISTAADDDDYEVVPGPRGGARRSGRAGNTLSAKAGIILGIANIFVVIPQFLVTGFSAILFALLDPQKPTLPSHRAPVAPAPRPAVGNGTALLTNNVTAEVISRGSALLHKFDLVSRNDTISVDDGSSNSVVYILRIGGVAALFAFVLSWRLSRELRHR